MNIIDIIAIIPYFITLATVVAEEEDTLNLPRAPVSPQVRFHYKGDRVNIPNVKCCFLISVAGQVNEPGYVLGHSTSDTFSSSVSNFQII